MSTTDTAYLAGLIDGEGCISIQRVQDRYYRAQLIIVQRDRPIIAWLQEKWGGKVDGVQRHDSFHTGKYWRWYTMGQAMQDLLEKVQPYLVLKRQQCDNAIALLRLRSNGNGRKGHPPEVKAEMERLYRANRSCNSPRAVAETE